jgi:hypothetical protein
MDVGGRAAFTGVQEVRSSNLLSSTGQKRNSNRSNSEVQQQSTATAVRWAAVRVFGSGIFSRLGCWQGTGFHALSCAWSACHLGKSRPVPWLLPPGHHPALQESGVCR